MVTVYFDIHNSDTVSIDDEGVDLPNTGAARRMGQMILDGAPKDRAGVTKVELRDKDGPLLRVSATVLIEEL
jgi:hypothetical protein